MSAAGAHVPSVPQTQIVLRLRGSDPFLDKVEFRNSAGKCDEVAGLPKKQLPQAVAVVLTLFRAKVHRGLFRIHSNRRKKCLVRIILNAKEEPLSKSKLRGLADGLFLQLFRTPAGRRSEYLEVDTEKLRPEAVHIWHDGSPVTQDFEALAIRIAATAKWEITTHRIDESFAAPQPSADISPPIAQRTFARMFDEALLCAYLTGAGFTEWTGTQGEWERLLRKGTEWLTAHPEDIYCRGMFFWSVLRMGNPSQMVTALRDTVQWSTASSPPLPSPGSTHDPATPPQIPDDGITRLNRIALDYAVPVRWYLEDAVVRAALLRHLKLHGPNAPTNRELAAVGGTLANHHALRNLLSSTKSQAGDSWVANAVAQVTEWAKFDHESALAELCLLWFTARAGQPSQMQSAIAQARRWLERNPDKTLVRWATIWLAGVCPEGEHTVRLIDDSAKWLARQSADQECLVRMGFLWLVGALGNAGQVRKAISHTTKWLKDNPNDDFIRLAYLLFLIRRRGTSQQRMAAASETRDWLSNHSDPYGLTKMALRLFESYSDQPQPPQET